MKKVFLLLLSGVCLPYGLFAYDSMVKHEQANLNDLFNFFKGSPLFDSTSVATETIEIILPNGAIDEKGIQQPWKAVIKKGKGKKNTALTIINAEIDENAKTYFFKEFGVNLNAKTHRLIAHIPFGNEPPKDVVELLSKINPAVRAFGNEPPKDVVEQVVKLCKYKYTSEEVVERLLKIQQRIFNNSTKILMAFAEADGRVLSEKKAKALVRLIHQNHLLHDLVKRNHTNQKSKKDVENSVVKPLWSAEELLDEMSRTLDDAIDDPIVREKIKNELNSIKDGAKDFTTDLKRLHPEYTDDVIKQEVADFVADKLTEGNISKALESEMGEKAAKKMTTEIAASTSQTGFVKGMAMSQIMPKTAVKWGGAAVLDGVITAGMLWYEDAEAKEYLKQGTALAAATTAAWATESVLVYAGMTTAFTSTSVVTVSGFLAPVPVVGPATLIAAGVYMGVRFGVCYAWDVHEQKEAERIERECQQIELRYVHGLREKMIEKNTQQLEALLEKE